MARYKSLAQGAEVLESQLKGQLAEYLNAEVVLLTVTDIATASAWLRDTFLYVRVRSCTQRFDHFRHSPPGFALALRACSSSTFWVNDTRGVLLPTSYF